MDGMRSRRKKRAGKQGAGGQKNRKERSKMIIWNEEKLESIDEKIRELMENYLLEHEDTDCFFEGFSADLSRYSGFRIEDCRLIQSTGTWKFFPVDWVCVKEEKYEDLINLLREIEGIL